MPKNVRVRPLALTVPERIWSARAKLDLTGSGRYVPLDKLPPTSTPMLVAPEVPVWNQGKPTQAQSEARRSLAARGRSVSVQLGKRTMKAVVVELGLRKARVELLHGGLDVGWYLSGRPAQALTTDGPTCPSPHAADPLADAAGATLAACLPAAVAVPSWNTAVRTGWVAGGPLGISCEQCSGPLLWRDWWYADATKAENTFFVFCPEHRGPVKRHRGQPLSPLVAARRQLDAALACSPAGARSVYVLEVVGKEEDAVYVGETCKPQTIRRLEHADGGPLAARVFRQAGVSAGALRPCLLPEQLVRLGLTQSICAEQWTAAVLRHHGWPVYGGH